VLGFTHDPEKIMGPRQNDIAGNYEESILGDAALNGQEIRGIGRRSAITHKITNNEMNCGACLHGHTVVMRLRNDLFPIAFDTSRLSGFFPVLLRSRLLHRRLRISVNWSFIQRQKSKTFRLSS
jgi:hypothetical protein